MGYQQHNHRLVHITAAAILIVAGCAPRMQRPMRVYPGAESADEALSILRLQSQNAVPLKANGRCLAKFYVEGRKKPKKENFPVKLWFSPPCCVRLQGDVAFNPRGIELGSNDEEFWLSMKPKEIGNSYFWGRWDCGGGFGALKISPEILLEAIGIIEVDDEENWSLSNEGAFDVLTKQNEQGIIIKKIYIRSGNYLVWRIEYFDVTGERVAVTELDKYKQVSEVFFVPAIIKIIRRAEDGREDSAKITLRSIKPAKITEEVRRRLFTRPQPKGFKHVYKIIDGNIIEQR